MNLLASITARTAGNSGHHGAAFFLILGIVFVVFGTLNAAKPELQWRMRRWQYKNKEANEPSDLALTVTRASGALFTIAGVVLIVVGIVKL